MTSRREMILHLPWIEKYRPSKVDNVTLDDHIKNQIKKMITNKELPNIILEGSPGVGKTSTIRCMAQDMYGKYYKYMVLELNASDDRGIKIQDSIKNFKQSYVHIKSEDKNSIPKYKLIILDEADNMTDKAKSIIRGFLENDMNDIRFAFTCNSKTNILPSIQSRCSIIRYPKLSNQIIFDRLKLICEFEKIITDQTKKSELKKISEGLEAICQITDGDMRNAINILQLTYNRFDIINQENVYEIYDKPHPEKSYELIDLCIKNDIGGALNKVKDMKNLGYSGIDIALGLVLALRMKICDDIPEEIKIRFIQKISYTMYNISKGADTFLQMSACICDLCE